MSPSIRSHALPLVAGLALGGLALAMRVRNALTYPPDWGFDATFTWQYIDRLTRDWSLPHPAASWATGDPPLFFYLSALVMRGCEALGSQASMAALGFLKTRFVVLASPSPV